VSNLLKKAKGFTLIEIVLVLAIAGLLLVIVFLAVSGAQKSRRDSQRKSDAGAYVSGLELYASNNNGTYPASGVSLAATYFSRNDPTGAPYTVSGAAPTAAGQMRYQLGVLCPGSPGAAGPRSYAVTVFIEQGGTYCADNH
jgi:prepilin-type N-terminal cleavage/methylation domain-containing protein